MNDSTVLPAYSERDLAGLDPAVLMALAVGDEDRVPRNVIDACAARGEWVQSGNGAAGSGVSRPGRGVRYNDHFYWS